MDQVMFILQLMLWKIIRIVIPITRLPILAAPRGSRSNAGTCAENDIINVSCDVNPTTNIEENNNDSDNQEDDKKT